MLQELVLKNSGVIMDDVPSELFSKIKEESKTLDTNNEIMTSGLTGKGVTKHFFMKQGYRKEFLEYVMRLKEVYLSVYPDFIKDFLPFSNDVPFVCQDPWFNVQKRGEFIPLHRHDGVISYSLWIKIPYDVQEEIEGGRHASCFEFNYSSITGATYSRIIEIDKSFEGKIIMFPSSLVHCVYPFYTVDDRRISMSGNISFDMKKIQC